MGESASSAFHLIRSLQVKGRFLDGVRVQFDPSLNCIIGGRGTGKTTVLEMLRWALDQIPDATASSSRARSIDKLVQANLGSGQVEVEIETDSGLPYRVRRSYGSAAMVLNASGEAVPIEIGRGTISSTRMPMAK